jgi:CRP-like cAMP-binding protein
VVASGSVELMHEEEIIDILEPGEAFGHPSPLTGQAPAFTVRAHEPTRCYAIPPAAAMSALARPAGVDFVHNLEREDLVALTVEAAAMARVPLAGTSWIPGA